MNVIITISTFLCLIFIYINFKFLHAIDIISRDKFQSSDLLKFSVVIAVKNEEENINPLIISLKKIFYPTDFLEIIIIDDNSTDNTYQLINDAIKEIEYIKLFKVGNKKFLGKKGALAFGIEKAINPYIIITDGDCLPQKNWLISFASKFSQGFDMVFGASPFIKKNSLINKISCFENLRISLLTFTAAIFGHPYSATARSLGFTKKIYEQIGGYKNTTETLSGDDDLLIREAVKHNAKIGCFIETGSLVFTKTVTSFKEYLKQKARHTSTSFYYLQKQKLFLVFWHFLNLLLLLSPLFIWFDSIFVFFFLIKILIDIFVIKRIQYLINYNFNFFEVFYLQIIYEFLLIINVINSKLLNIKWKD